jgi:hypothetical protein
MKSNRPRTRTRSTFASAMLCLAGALLLSSASMPSRAATVWDRTIVHPLPTGRMLPGDRCHFASWNCAGTGLHLGVDLMAAAGTAAVSMCNGIVRHNNTATASIWDSKVIIEHNCGGPFQKVFGHYGHVSSSLAVNTAIDAGTIVGTLKDDGGNSHLHMGLSYSQHTTGWGYGSSAADWINFSEVVSRPSIKPALVSPQQNSSTGNTASFVWNATSGSTSYRLVVSKEPNPLRNFDNFTRTCGEPSNGGAACWTNPSSLYESSLTRDMTAGATYYWVVRGDNTDWSDIGVFTVGTEASSSVWSSGVYRNNESLERVLNLPGVSAIDVTISGSLESNYDFLYVYDAGGRLVGTYTGAISTRVRVSGSSVKLRFTSDGSVVDAGVSVSIANATSTTEPTAGVFDQCYSKYSQYFGPKIGSTYECYGTFTCQQTTGPVTLLAVEKSTASNLLYYYWGGWSTLDMQSCR